MSQNQTATPPRVHASWSGFWVAVLVTLVVSVGTVVVFDREFSWVATVALLLAGFAGYRSIRWRSFGTGLLIGALLAGPIILVDGLLLWPFLP